MKFREGGGGRMHHEIYITKALNLITMICNVQKSVILHWNIHVYILDHNYIQT